MWTAAFMMHRAVSIVFLILIPLPFLALKKALYGARFWKRAILAANISLLVVLVSGLLIYPSFQEGKTWIVLILIAAMGGTLGMMSKGIKQYLAEAEPEGRQPLKKVTVAGIAYIIILVVILAFMTNWYAF
ncbi:hypothetical protein [Mesobacillus harenae]|uniref:hypothetical protein n=1 Tax=Mesobacillus harenae TaxID=2213203 RepID=UPI001580B014|nr:hypothetical protein [Mesobacillus harenae]